MFTSLKDYFRKNKLLLILFFFFIIIRLPFLDHAFLLRGERDIALTGYSLAKTGRDLYGNFLPLQFSGLDMPTPFLAFYYSCLWWIFIPVKSVFTARLPFVFITGFYIFLINYLVILITKNKRVALITSVVFCFSPGIYHLSRLALEINLAMPLLLLAIIMYLKKQRMAGWFLFILSFFTYNGFRPLIPFLIIYLEWWLNIDNKAVFLKKAVICTAVYLILFVFSYLLIDGKMMSSRSSDLVFFGYESINPLVDLRRNTAIGPTLFKQIANNKITNTAYYIIEVFFAGQSLDYLFLKGDKAAIYATTFTGQFFIIGLLFYYLGILNLGRLWKKGYFYFIGFIPIALIPSLINIDYVSITIRSALASVGYAMIIALGFILFYEHVKKINRFYILTVYSVIALILAMEIGYFSYNYFFRRPITMFESFFESEKQVAEYLIKSDQKLTIYDDSPKNILTAYYLINPVSKVNDLHYLLNQNNKYRFGKFIIYNCPESGKKQQMLKKGSVVSDSCLEKPLYDKLENDGKTDKINFKDYSFKTAYFIIK